MQLLAAVEEAVGFSLGEDQTTRVRGAHGILEAARGTSAAGWPVTKGLVGTNMAAVPKPSRIESLPRSFEEPVQTESPHPRDLRLEDAGCHDPGVAGAL